jgi:hypothetical protein
MPMLDRRIDTRNENVASRELEDGSVITDPACG